MLTVSASGGRGNADGQDVTWTNTQVSAGNQVILTSRGETSLKGAVVAAPQITSQAKNLTIQSLQDTSQFNSKQQSLGGSISIGYGQMSGSVQSSKGKANSDFANVTEQSGFKAGDQGFNVQVTSNTDLKGGAITSTQKAINEGKNSFSSQTLSLSDLQNQASYKASSVGINIGAGASLNGKLAPQGSGAGIGKDGDQVSSKTTAAISGIAGNKEARTGDSESGIAKIFDADKVQKDINAQVQITQTFGREASRAVANYAASKLDEIKAQKKAEAEKTDIDLGKLQVLKEEQQKWEEGGIYRVALHTAVGGLTSGAAGAAGVSVASRAAPIINDLQDRIEKGLENTGASVNIAKATAQFISGITAAGIGSIASGGSIAGAATASNADFNNRQLSPTEKQRIKALAKNDSQKEARLTAAACAMAHCYAQYPEGSQAYKALKAMADAGASDAFIFERQLLGQQQGLFGYTITGMLSDQNIDAEKRLDNTYQVTARVLGAGQTVLGTLGVAATVTTAPASCVTGLGCVANAAGAAISADVAYAGAKQTVSGKPENTIFNQALQTLGMSPGAATYAEFALGVGAAAKAGSVINAATAAQTAMTIEARLAYEPIEKFGAKGMQVTEQVLDSIQAQRLISEYVAAGVSPTRALQYTSDLLKTGKELPIAMTANQGTELIKLVPKNIVAGDSIASFSPYFITRAQYEDLAELPASEIAKKLGLPAEQGIRGSQLGFDVYSMTPIPGNTPQIFRSEIAPIEHGAYSASGGAQQILVPNRSLWTDPNTNKIASIPGGRK
jgi:filamentous hemagglutinin